MRSVNVEGLARFPSFSHAIVAGQDVFVSGAIGAVPGTTTLPDGIAAETRQVLENMKSVLRAAGCELSDVVKVGVYLTDLSQFAVMDGVYGAFFGEHAPARVTVGVSELALGAHVEMDCTARFSQD